MSGVSFETSAGESHVSDSIARNSTERWKTLSRKDPEFISYLDGSFSETHRALPVRSLNVETQAEQVTFEIIALSEIQKPSIWRAITLLVRPPSLVLSAGPMLATLFYSLAHSSNVHFPLVISCFIGVLAFHISLNLFNDYNDHIRGQDRLRPHGGSRVIQKGWIRAFSVRRGAWGLMGLAILCSLPALFLSPAIIVASLALLVGLEFAFQFLRLKARGWAEILAFALTGPLLTCGFAWATTYQVDLKVFAMGCVFGSIALLYFHSANFENILPDKQARVRTWATRTGFDASKTFYFFVASLSFASAVTYALFFEREWKLLLAVLAQALILIPASLRVRKLASPLSSELRGLRMEAVKLCLWTTVALIGGYLWIFASGSIGE